MPRIPLVNMIKSSASVGGLVLLTAVGYVAVEDMILKVPAGGTAPQTAGYLVEELLNNSKPEGLGEADIIGVFLGESGCPASNLEIVHVAVKVFSYLIGKEALARSLRYRMVGIAADPSPSEGLAYLDDFDVFVERVAGRKWAEASNVRQLAIQIGESTSRPQLLVFERPHHDSPVAPPTRAHELRLRLVGAFEIERWLTMRAHIPALAPDA